MKRKMSRFINIVIILAALVSKSRPEEGRTILEELIIPFRQIRLILQEALSPKKNEARNNKMQQVVPDTVPFPCDLKYARSFEKPKSVHQLRPGDIDIIAAMGDSLTVGFGLSATNLVGVVVEERGRAFSGGGEGSWREFLTLPNILKEFNPSLVGYAKGSVLSIQEGSQFNVAEGAAISANMPYMAKQLIKRLRNHEKVNISEDWKMVTIFIGSNDFCGNICYLRNPKKSLIEHRKDMIEVLKLLRDNLPRTIVNLIPAVHLSVLVEMKMEPLCDLTHLVECPCLFGLPNKEKKPLMYKIMDLWQKMDIEIGNMEEFDLDNFTVVVQPLSVNYSFPVGSYGLDVFDQSYLSADCFHFSQKMNALVANELWNNLLEPVGKKSFGVKHYNLYEKFNCPTERNPFIFTRRNS